jgi:erythromycin esterase
MSTFDTNPLNDYINTGKGDPVKLMPTLTPAWQTQEVLDMINWMKKHNEKGENKIQFTGFDIQSFNGPLYQLITYAKQNDKDLYNMVDSLSDMLTNPYQTNKEIEIKNQNFLKIKKCNQILSYLKKTQNESDGKKDGNEINVIIQNANVIHQYLDYFSNGHPSTMRDKYMAENVTWILDNYPNAKIVLWAHNEHISKQKYWMGDYLSKKYNEKYYSVGFLTNEGKYTAGIGDGVSTENKLIKGEPGSFEFNFNKTGLPCFFFDLNSINKNEPNSLWLEKKLKQRNIGGDATDEQFSPALLRQKFDGIIYINSTTASRTFLPTNIKLTK